MEPIVFAILAAALFGAALVTTHSGLKYLEATAGARISIPAAALPLWLREERMRRTLIGGVMLIVTGVVVLLLQW